MSILERTKLRATPRYCTEKGIKAPCRNNCPCELLAVLRACDKAITEIVRNAQAEHKPVAEVVRKASEALSR